MNILTMLWKNLMGGSRTILFPARPRVSERYRGRVRFDPTLCTGCANSTGAMSRANAPFAGAVWKDARPMR
jgi:hypothetical protein